MIALILSEGFDPSAAAARSPVVKTEGRIKHARKPAASAMIPAEAAQARLNVALLP